MPQGNPFSSSSRHQMNSNAITDQRQGGGSKKAGFPQMVGRSYGVSIALDNTDPVHGHCAKLSCYQKTLFPFVRESRPIGTLYSANYNKFHIPNAGH